MISFYNKKEITALPSDTDALDLIVKYKEERDNARLWRDNYKNITLNFANQIGELNKVIDSLKQEIEDLEEANKILLMENEQLDKEVEEAGNNSCELDREYNKLEFDYAMLESERDKLVTQLDEIITKSFMKDCISKEAVLNLLAVYDPEFHGNFSDCIKSLPTVADFLGKIGGIDGEQERDNH